MHWYVVHVKHNCSSKLVSFFNRQENVQAFIPKTERWYNIKGKKDYVIKDLYPDYVFIKTALDKLKFEQQFSHFFEMLDGIATLLETSDIYVFDNQEQELLEKVFNNEKIIKHSVGNIINSKLIVDHGPLVGLEEKVIKIDRHKRLASLKLNKFALSMEVPLEVVSKS